MSLEYATPSAAARLAGSALIFEPETDSRGVQRAAFNVHIVVHIWNSITGYPSIMEMKSIWDIHIWNLSTYDTQAIKTQENMPKMRLL